MLSGVKRARTITSESANSGSRKTFLLTYDYVDNIVEKRLPFRADHLELTHRWVKNGNLLLGGAFSQPVDGAAIAFVAENEQEIVDNFVTKDPYFLNGLVTKYQVRPWTVVVGSALPSGQISEEKLSEASPETSEISGMTGFARVEGSVGKYIFSWEARSLNGRSLELKFRIPESYVALQPVATSAATERFSRGSIVIYLNVERSDCQDGQIVVSKEDLQSVAEQVLALQSSQQALKTFSPPSMDSLLAIPGIVKWKPLEESEGEKSELMASLGEGLWKVLDKLHDSRKGEGAKLRSILTVQFQEIEKLASDATESAASRPENMRAKLIQQVNELLAHETRIEPGRLEQEVAFLVSRFDVREELERLKIHAASGKALMAGESKEQQRNKKGKKTVPIGRSLDFLTQELLREANTLCAKANDIALTQIGLKLKGVIEQVKEQSANVE